LQLIQHLLLLAAYMKSLEQLFCLCEDKSSGHMLEANCGQETSPRLPIGKVFMSG